MKKKTVDKNITLKNKTWSFDSNFAKKFDNHIQKSIPCLNEFRWLCLEISDYFIKDKTRVYDLGCSTGSFLNEVYKRHAHKKKINFVGVDIVKDMLKYAKKNFKKKTYLSFLKI